MDAVFAAAKLSCWVGFFSTIIVVPLSLTVALCLHRSKWRSLEALFLLPLFLPPTVTGFVLLWSLSPLRPLGHFLERMGVEIVFTVSGTILACVVVSFPLAFQVFMVGLSRLDSVTLESGTTLGGTQLFNAVRVVLPQLKSALLVASLFAFGRAIGEFGASILVGGNTVGETQTLPLAVYSFAQSGDFASAGWATLASMVLSLIIYGGLRFLEQE